MASTFEALLLAQLNNLLNLQWQSYTPSFNGTIGNGGISGTYVKIGRMVTAQISLVLGSTTTISGNLLVGLPFTAATLTLPSGAIYSFSGSVFGIPATGNTRTGVTNVLNGSSTLSAFSDNVSTGFWTGTSPTTWGTGAQFVFQITYQSAS